MDILFYLINDMADSKKMLPVGNTCVHKDGGLELSRKDFFHLGQLLLQRPILFLEYIFTGQVSRTGNLD